MHESLASQWALIKVNVIATNEHRHSTLSEICLKTDNLSQDVEYVENG
jgi:hypothetical protein